MRILLAIVAALFCLNASAAEPDPVSPEMQKVQAIEKRRAKLLESARSHRELAERYASNPDPKWRSSAALETKAAERDEEKAKKLEAEIEEILKSDARPAIEARVKLLTERLEKAKAEVEAIEKDLAKAKESLAKAPAGEF